MKRLSCIQKYDMADATEVGSDCFPGSVRDSRHYAEILYRLKNDNWLLVGLGGPKTKYSSQKTDGKKQLGGRAFFLLSEQEAQAWIKKSRRVISFTEKITLP